MGPLASHRIPSETVTVPGTETKFQVHGLSGSDVAELFRRHGDALSQIYADQIDGTEGLPAPQAIAQAIMRAAPEALAEIIAFAAGEPDAVDSARHLPLPVQVDALAKIASLTFYSEQEVKNLLETVILGSGMLTTMVRSLSQPEL